MQNDIRKNGQKKVFTIVYSWIDSKHEFKSGDAVAGRAGAIRLNFVSEWPRLDPDYILTVLNFRQISCHSLGPASPAISQYQHWSAAGDSQGTCR